MKKFLMLTVSVICLLAVLTACSQKGTEAASDKTDDETQTINTVKNKRTLQPRHSAIVYC